VLFSVIIVNWNSSADLEQCLLSLKRQRHSQFETIVVDNGSSDGSLEMLAASWSDVRTIATGENLGFAEACNRGIEVSTGEWAVLLNNDAVVESDWAERLAHAIENAAADCGMLQSAMYFLGDGAPINSLGLYLTRSGGAIDRFEGEHATVLVEEPIFCPTGGAAAYRRSMLEAIRLPTGYLDRRYFCYSEDFDLGWRAQLSGWSGRLVPDAIVRHKRHGSTQRRGRAWFVRMTRINRLRTLVKNASPAFLLMTAPYTFYELIELAWHSGISSFAELPRAIRDSLEDRGHVEQLRKLSRREIEQRWVGRC
jgi:GT2 family glycosyltransferase